MIREEDGVKYIIHEKDMKFVGLDSIVKSPLGKPWDNLIFKEIQ